LLGKGCDMVERSVFTVGQTHGILTRAGNLIEAASDGLGWESLYASARLCCKHGARPRGVTQLGD